MTMDIDGYGPRPEQSQIDRLLEDCRTLSASGIERVARGWVHDAGPGWAERVTDHGEESSATHAAWVASERAALHVVETSHRGDQWDRLRGRILDMTEHHDALISWREEHGDVGHRAEDALLGAALALSAQPELDSRHMRILLGPMSAALPWLLESVPAQSGP